VISGKQRYLRFVACIQVLDTWQCPGEYSWVPTPRSYVGPHW
jgi:hypothetical protein